MSKLVTIQIQRSKKSKKLKMKFDPDRHTIRDVKQAYCDEEAPSMKPETMVLYKLKKELENDSATLRYYNITRVAVLSMTVRLVGGAQYVANHKILNNNRYRNLNTSDPDIKLTQQLCSVYLDNKYPRAQMPCGHAICSLAMFNLAKSIITRNEYDFQILCPAKNCGKELDFDFVAKVADMTDDEYLYFYEELTKRAMPETQTCPNAKCDADCERPASLSQFRVNCTACSGGDWCWLCNGKWLGGGFSLCGNKDCPSTEMNEKLQTCPMKKTTYKNENNEYVVVPKIRACPNCLEFIEHSDACKHMHCEFCGHDFCFSCLKGKSNGNWQCGSVSYQCQVAPRQKLN